MLHALEVVLYCQSSPESSFQHSCHQNEHIKAQDRAAKRFKLFNAQLQSHFMASPVVVRARQHQRPCKTRLQSTAMGDGRTMRASFKPFYSLHRRLILPIRTEKTKKIEVHFAHSIHVLLPRDQHQTFDKFVMALYNAKKCVTMPQCTAKPAKPHNSTTKAENAATRENRLQLNFLMPMSCWASLMKPGKQTSGNNLPIDISTDNSCLGKSSPVTGLDGLLWRFRLRQCSSRFVLTTIYFHSWSLHAANFSRATFVSRTNVVLNESELKTNERVVEIIDLLATVRR
ncbi:hypothetical protein MVEN_00037700 [Mycena venus]|uniref:Uncharacterized protein n=1 Tax=Mycena venus TaxID=2733690 RepID=A0A8H6Z9T8_9AGAR|nr:hypothetical protein MVEN_00037700 [Mycena venus]